MDTDLLAALIAKKHSLLEQLRDAGRRQAELIDSGDMGQLLKVLASKQYVINGLQEVERQLDPFRRQDPERRVWRTTADRELCAKQAAACEALLAQVVAEEKRSETRLIAHRDRTAALLESAHHAAQARSAYLDGGAVEYRQLDLSTGG